MTSLQAIEKSNCECQCHDNSTQLSNEELINRLQSENLKLKQEIEKLKQQNNSILDMKNEYEEINVSLLEQLNVSTKIAEELQASTESDQELMKNIQNRLDQVIDELNDKNQQIDDLRKKLGLKSDNEQTIKMKSGSFDGSRMDAIDEHMEVASVAGDKFTTQSATERQQDLQGLVFEYEAKEKDLIKEKEALLKHLAEEQARLNMELIQRNDKIEQMKEQLLQEREIHAKEMKSVLKLQHPHPSFTGDVDGEYHETAALIRNGSRRNRRKDPVARKVKTDPPSFVCFGYQLR